MRRPLLRHALLGLIALAAIPAALQAQTSSASLKEVSQISVSEKTRLAQVYLANMDVVVKEVTKMLEDAEKGKDDVRVACLEKKLTTMKIMQQISQDSFKNMTESATSGKDAMVDTAFRQVSVMHAKILQYRAEADACVGDKSRQAGTTAVQLVESGLLGEESTVEPMTDEAGIDQPPPASPYQ